MSPDRLDEQLALEKFERTLAVSSDAARCWSVLTDVEQLVSWVQILHSAQELDHLASYTAVLEDRVGPFNLRADLSISVQVVEDGAVVDVAASGRDRAINSQIEIEGRLAITPVPGGGSEVAINGKYQVTGRATSLGSGIVRKKGEAALTQFTENAVAVLGAAAQSS